MSKKLLTLLLFPLLSLGSCASDRVEEELETLSSIERKSIVTREESTEERLKLKALYEKTLRLKNEFRSYYSPSSEREILRMSNDILKNNIYNLNGSLFHIIGVNPSGEKVSLSTAGTSVWGNKTGEEVFHIKALPSAVGIPYIIYKDENKKVLGAGSLNINGQKKSMAYIGPNNNNWFGFGWDIIPTDKGLFIENDMVYTKNDEPATMDNIEKRVLACSSISNGKVALVSRDEKDATQMFSIVPQDKFHILGIRYFSDGEQASLAIHNLDVVKGLGDEVVILDSLSHYTSNDYNSFGDLRAKVTKMSNIKIEKTYTNNTYKDMPVDMYFDKRVRQYSTYNEVSGIKFSELLNSQFPLPFIEGQVLKYSPKNTHSPKVFYKSNYIDRDLKGVLYLMISPRTEATVEYSYSVYSIELPYLVFLTPVNSDNIVCALGVWKGYIYTEQDTDKHRFHKTPIDSGGDDEEIIFEMDNYDLERLGYKENEDGFRATSSIRKRIHL